MLSPGKVRHTGYLIITYLLIIVYVLTTGTKYERNQSRPFGVYHKGMHVTQNNERFFEHWQAVY